MSETATLGGRLSLARTSAKLTQGELARLTRMSQQSIADIENDKSKSTGRIGSLAHHTGVRALWLETGQGPMRDESEGIGEASAMYGISPTDREYLLQLAAYALPLSPAKRRALLVLLDAKAVS